MLTSLIILIFLPYIQSQSKVLIASGMKNYNADPALITEIIDLLDESNICKPVPDFPIYIDTSTGGVVKVLNRYAALICGFPYLIVDYPCVALYEDSTTVIGMTFQRIQSQGIVINNTNLWVTGGLASIEGTLPLKDVLSSTELIDAEYKTHTPGPELPSKLYSHCVLSIDPNLAMIVGGYEGNTRDEAVPTKKTYFYDLQTNHWTPGPDLNTARADLACSVLKVGADTYVIVTGGSIGTFWEPNPLKSTEILSMTSQQWISGPDLPLPLSKHSMVTVLNKVYVIGGMLDWFALSMIYELDQEMTQWREMKQYLSEPRFYMVALAVPDTMASCSKREY